MLPVLSALRAFAVGLFRSRGSLCLAHLALRHQLAVYKQTAHRPRLRLPDRLFWVWLSRLWSGWQATLVFVQPRTVIAWQQRFRDHWRRLSQRGTSGLERTMVPNVSQDVSGVSHIKKVCDWQRWCLPHVHRHVGRPPSSSRMVKYMSRTAVKRLVPLFAPTARWVHTSRTVWCHEARTRVTWCRSPRGALVMPVCSCGAGPLSRSSGRTSQTGPAVAAGSGHSPGLASRAG
jgi:hypothetical protein